MLLIVCIPEGLTLAAQIAMALSIDQLKDDKILVKNHDAIQKAATVTDICVSKTGVLTSGKGKVKKYYLAGDDRIFDNESSDTNFRVINCRGKADFIDCILMNSDVTFQAEDPFQTTADDAGDGTYEYVYRAKGQPLEVAAINLLNGVDPEKDARMLLEELRST